MANHQHNILIVEDDNEIARIMVDHLRKAGYRVTWASTGQEGWEDFKEADYDIVLVDLMLPEMDGFTLCQKIRLESEVPILIVSAKHEDESKIHGLNLGADDYLTKPFSLQELSARIKSHLRRYDRYLHKEQNYSVTTYRHGLLIDLDRNIVSLDRAPLKLTLIELDILLLLAKNPLRTFSKPELYEHVWQQKDTAGNNTVTVHIKSLRNKLKDPTKNPLFIETVWGIGYRFIGEITDEN